MEYIARINEDTNDEQLLKTHLNNVANICEKYASAFKTEKLAYQIGYLHDIGKYSHAFQKRIRGNPLRVDHSTAGAKLAQKKFNKLLSTICGYCIAGHHAGLPDLGCDADNAESPTLKGRLKKPIEDYDFYKTELVLKEFDDVSEVAAIVNASKTQPDFALSLYTRMLFSCLVDADYLDTERFMKGETNRSIDYDFCVLRQKLNDKLKQFEHLSGVINQKRREILQSCLSAAEEEKGMFRLSVPTGGGKTLSSMAFAISHLLKHDLKRIIYVIPYSSIIEQTALDFKKIFGEEYVLEHHFNYEYDYDENNKLSPMQERFKLATQNWDMPIIITTNVQFFESLFSNKSSRCRKLHNICQSVIIFDEVQMFSYDFLKPCLMAISELVNNYDSSVVFCSATQPNFDFLLAKHEIKEIVKNSNELEKVFKRTEIVKAGVLSENEIIEKIKILNQVLVVVNSRKEALSLYEKLNDDQSFCLTTLMTPGDRKEAIKRIKTDLSEGKNCRVISTQLIEAGVDIDFPVVYRAIAGIDSIIQSAGRCNREGRLDKGQVYVFSPEKEPKRKGHLLQGIQIGNMIMNEYKDINSSEAIEAYFKNAYDASNLDINKTLNCFIKKNNVAQLDYDFKKAADDFKLIDNDQKQIIIPDEEIAAIIEKIKYSKTPGIFFNKLQQKSVSVYSYEFNKLFNDKKIFEVLDGLFMLQDNSLYSTTKGLNIFYDEKNDFLCV